MHTPVARAARRASSTGRRLSKPLVLPAFTGCDVTVIGLLLGTFALFRSADLSHSVAHQTSVAELALPVVFWATGFWFVAALILFGVAAQRHFLLWLGHSLGVVLYLGLTVGALLHLITAQETGPITGLLPAPWWFIALGVLCSVVIVGVAFADGRGGPAPIVTMLVTLAASLLVSFSPVIPLDGSRVLGPLICVTVMHGYMAVRMGPLPLTAPEMAR